MGQLEAARASIDSARLAAGRANAKHIALRIERESARIAEKAGDLVEALASMKAVAARQRSLGRGSTVHLLRHLQMMTDQNGVGSTGLSPGGRHTLTR